DVPASVTTAELKQLIEGVRFIERALHNPVNKTSMANDLAEMKRIFGKSLFAARELPAGMKITFDDLAFKKPGTGIPASRYAEYVGRTLARAVTTTIPLAEEDFE
ncbi:MAG: N-acetylneuraminate synthase, partial [Acidobacteria bacterium]|nr:N-acetylneuraminate synthase [Acidobacteriota bacterium]